MNTNQNLDRILQQILVSYLTDFMPIESHKGKSVGMLLVDPQKVFNAVNHSIHLDKLNACDLNPCLDWFKLYL